MNEMVERVAKAISQARAKGGDDARAAIAAMHEPTEAMIDAGRAVTATWLNIEGSGLTIAREKMKRRWQAMNAVALNDGHIPHGRL